MNRIKEVLEKKGIKQIWLAEQLGKSYNMVHSYAQNKRQPSIENLYRIANIIDVDISQLLINNKNFKEPLFEYKKNEIDINNVANNLYTVFNKIKRIIPNSNIFIYFIFIREFIQYLKLNEQDANQILNSFNKDNFNIKSDLKNVANQFNISLNDSQIGKINLLLKETNIFNICVNYKYISNTLIGILTEKIITKKDTGAYYTTFETTDYIITNSIIPQIINKLASCNNNLLLFLSSYELKNGISFIEENIKTNTILNSFIELEKKYNSKKQLSKIISNLKIIDISCGSGSFIFGTITFINKLNELITEDLKIDFNNIYGNDIDEDAISIIKTRLILEKYFSDTKTFIFNINNFKVKNTLIKNTNSLFSNQNNETELSFDIVLGNPPYLEKRKIGYSLEHYQSKKCGNIYAMFLEENINILKEGGSMGMIVPISYISTNRMNPIRQILKHNSKYEFCSSFADRPSCLFNGVHQKLNIILLEKESNSKQKNLYTSSYIHWYKDEKEGLFKSIKYTVNEFSNKDFYYKIGNNIEKKIIKKLTNHKTSLLDNLSKQKNTKHKVWLNMRLCFWNKAFISEQTSSEYKAFFFDKKTDSIIFSSLINSNIFFFFWETISDAWHITNKDLNNLKIDFSSINQNKREHLSKKYYHFEKHLESTKKYIGSKQTLYEYQHKKSKLLIDEFDTFFADYFELSNQELKYIKNFQLKYRMNDELNTYLKNRGYESN